MASAIKAITLSSLILSVAISTAGQKTREPRSFFREQIGLTDAEIAMISRGTVVAKVLPSKTPADIVVFSAVFVDATPEEYVKLAFDMSRLRRLPGYLGVGRFSNPPRLSDLEGFTLDPEDIRDLRVCRPGQCNVQLPAEAMQELQRAIDWSGPDVDTQVNDRVRRMALELLRRYQLEGNSALGNYRDKAPSFDVNAQLRMLLSRSEALPIYLPELSRYLLDYPKSTPANVKSLFYWEKINFGLKPTLRMNHAIAYRFAGPKGGGQVVAVKQLYASHYFQLALDLTACVTESGRTSGKGFYLISLKGSTQQGLTGWKGWFLRRRVVSKTLATQEKTLINIKKTLEEIQ